MHRIDEGEGNIISTGEYIGVSFGLLTIELALVVAFMAITVLCIPKTVVKTAPKDIAKIVQKRPDEPMWKRILGMACALLILLGIAFLLVWAGYKLFCFVLLSAAGAALLTNL